MEAVGEAVYVLVGRQRVHRWTQCMKRQYVSCWGHSDCID